MSKEQPAPPVDTAPLHAPVEPTAPVVVLPAEVYQAVLQTIGRMPWEQVAPLMSALIDAGKKANA
jgi:hypothetical protein